jgi:transcriptional regulator with XRE-family HTH domain
MNAIAFYRKKSKQTQQELADFLQIDRTTVSKWESGKATPKAKMLPVLARAIGTTVEALYEDCEGKEAVNA